MWNLASLTAPSVVLLSALFIVVDF